MRIMARSALVTFLTIALIATASIKAEDAKKDDLFGQLFGAVKEKVNTTIEQNKADEEVKKRQAAEQEALHAQRQKEYEEKARIEAERKKAEPPPAVAAPAQAQPAGQAEFAPAVDAQGKPVLDAQGRQIYVDANGKPVPLDAQGNPVSKKEKDDSQLTEAEKKYKLEVEKNKSRDEAVSRIVSDQLKYKDQQAQEKLANEKKN